jgi:glycyl-tRNA synthetase beta subunit
MKELLLEIGAEEIPAGFVPQALIDLRKSPKESWRQAGLILMD